MGLKTNNYVSKSTGIHLPIAYAVLRNLVIEANSQARAVFAIQTDRENAKKYTPIDKVEVHFEWDRKTDPAKMAYEVAKTQMVSVYSEMGEETKKNGVLFGWQNDIV